MKRFYCISKVDVVIGFNNDVPSLGAGAGAGGGGGGGGAALAVLNERSGDRYDNANATSAVRPCTPLSETRNTHFPSTKSAAVRAPQSLRRALPYCQNTSILSRIFFRLFNLLRAQCVFFKLTKSVVFCTISRMVPVYTHSKHLYYYLGVHLIIAYEVSRVTHPLRPFQVVSDCVFSFFEKDLIRY